MTRIEARETLMQILYELDTAKDISGGDAGHRGGEIIRERMSGNHIERSNALLNQIIDNLTDIDGEINKHSTKWKTTRMPKVDLAIMRLAIGEMRYSDDVPDAVVINEAINLAKKYSTENSAKFIHGVLGAVSKDNQ
ncbi:MAG: transcription antitermination factor NusB [Bacillota bacterium]|nr:transcription antitermination factor NusB [Bacillota bacterium]